MSLMFGYMGFGFFFILLLLFIFILRRDKISGKVGVAGMEIGRLGFSFPSFFLRPRLMVKSPRTATVIGRQRKSGNVSGLLFSSFWTHPLFVCVCFLSL